MIMSGITAAVPGPTLTFVQSNNATILKTFHRKKTTKQNKRPNGFSLFVTVFLMKYTAPVLIHFQNNEEFSKITLSLLIWYLERILTWNFNGRF